MSWRTLLSRRSPRLDAALALSLVIMALATALYARNLGQWFIDDDEEGYFYAAWRVEQGDFPYRDFLTPQLPAFLYPGAAVVAVTGRNPVALRVYSIGLVLVAGFAVFLSGRLLAGAPGGLAAMSFFLLNEDVFGIGRSYRPEATMLAATALGLYAFLRADQRRSATGYAASGLLFGVGLLAKLFSALPWGAAIAYLASSVLVRRRSLSEGIRDIALVALPGLALVAGTMGAFYLVTPETYAAVLGHQLRQGAGLSRAQVAWKGLAFLGSSLERSAAIWAFVPAGIVALRKLAGYRGYVIAWYVPTALAFLLLSRRLFHRHLVYMTPAWALFIGVFLAWLMVRMAADGGSPEAGKRAGGAPTWAGILAAGTVFTSLAAPQFFDMLDTARLEEVGTPRLKALINALVPPGSMLISDYPGVGFFGDRMTTRLSAGLSEGATESGQITGDMLLHEMDTQDVAVVLVDLSTEGAHLQNLLDFDAFMAGVRERYSDLGHFWRNYQYHEVFARKDLPLFDVDYGWAKLVAARPTRGTVAAGVDAVDLDLVFTVKDRTDVRYTAFVHLVGPGGRVWAQGDSLPLNGLQRATEEWEADEVAAIRLPVPVPAGTPPGTYRLRVGLYDRTNGKRLPYQGAGGTLDAFDAATVEVVAPDTPAKIKALPTAPPGQAQALADPGADLGTVGPYRLLAAQAPDHVEAGTELDTEWLWEVAAAPGRDDSLHVEVVGSGPSGTVIGRADAEPAGGRWPTSSWRDGEIGRVRVPVVVDAEAAGEGRLRATWVDPEGNALGPPLTGPEITITALPAPARVLPADAVPVGAQVGDATLVAARVPDSAVPGQVLEVSLYWRTAQPLPRAYTVLVHVVDADGNVVAQADGAPAGGARPTTSWRAGEIVEDVRRVQLPDKLAAGTLRVLTGLYDPRDPSLARLPVVLDGQPLEDDRAPVGTVTVGGDATGG